MSHYCLLASTRRPWGSIHYSPELNIITDQPKVWADIRGSTQRINNKDAFFLLEFDLGHLEVLSTLAEATKPQKNIVWSYKQDKVIKKPQLWVEDKTWLKANSTGKKTDWEEKHGKLWNLLISEYWLWRRRRKRRV